MEEYAQYYDQLQTLNQEFPGKLKKALLQFAIEGKLVPQDKSEGTGADLLQKIRKENPPRRNRGQEKRHPSQSEGLSVGAVTAKVNSPSNGRGGPILERGPAGWVDEQPFAIPDNWCWCRLGEIVDKTIKRGKSPKYILKSNIMVFAQKCNVKSCGINMNLALYLDEATIGKYLDEEFMLNGDIVINSTGTGTLGRVGIFFDTDRIGGLKIVPDSHVTTVR